MPQPLARKPRAVTLDWRRQYRIVASKFRPIDVFEQLVPVEDRAALEALDGLTNMRLRNEAGELRLVAPDDRVYGLGASVVMAAFTHIGRPSRFSDGSYGVYYAARDLETAIRETVYHRERFMRYTQEPGGELDMRTYVGQIKKPMLDIRGRAYRDLHAPDDYRPSQQFAKPYRIAGAWGFVYRSVRHAGGQCIAALRPPAVSIPKQGIHLTYIWDGERIVDWYQKTSIKS